MELRRNTAEEPKPAGDDQPKTDTSTSHSVLVSPAVPGTQAKYSANVSSVPNGSVITVTGSGGYDVQIKFDSSVSNITRGTDGVYTVGTNASGSVSLYANSGSSGGGGGGFSGGGGGGGGGGGR